MRTSSRRGQTHRPASRRVAARRALLRCLAHCPAERWWPAASFVAAVKVADPDFQRPDGVYTGWYLREEGSAQYLTGFESWDAVEGQLIRFLVRGPLFWLGAVALSGEPGGAAEEAATLFRLTPVGVAWLARRTPPSLPRPAHLSVDDAFEVTAPLLLPLFDRYRLLQITDAGVTAGGERWETRRGMRTPAATRHRITRASLARARAAGVARRASAGRAPAWRLARTAASRPARAACPARPIVASSDRRPPPRRSGPRRRAGRRAVRGLAVRRAAECG